MTLIYDIYPVNEDLRFRLLTVEWVHLAACKHIGKNEVFEDLYSLG
jgi:hypothetical protein